MLDAIGVILSLIGAVVLAGIVMASGNIIVAIIVFIVSFAYLYSKFQEGASNGSGYRIEKQNEEIIQELHGINDCNSAVKSNSDRLKENDEELNRIDNM